MAILTLSRQYGSRGDELACHLAAALGFELATRETLERLMSEKYGDPLPDNPLYADLLSAVVADLGAAGSFVLAGRGGQFLLADAPATFHLRVVARREERIGNVAAQEGLDRAAAAERVRQRDAEQSAYVRAAFRGSVHRSHAYHLVLNLGALGFQAALELALAAVEKAGLHKDAGLLPPGYAERLRLRGRLNLAAESGSLRPGAAQAPRPSTAPFAHPSEQEFARLMDFHRIDWQYEPRTFPIEWDASGAVREAFTPDFYLPEMDLYVELTTMKQSLVRRKNHKIKRLGQLYPEANIRVFYQKDIEDLVFKLGSKTPVDLSS